MTICTGLLLTPRQLKRERQRIKKSERKSVRVFRRHKLFNQLMDAQNGECIHCGGLMNITRCRQASEEATWEHLIPTSAGGTSKPQNLALAHALCNQRRGTESLSIAATIRVKEAHRKVAACRGFSPQYYQLSNIIEYTCGVIAFNY